jgi:hypothetical protein
LSGSCYCCSEYCGWHILSDFHGREYKLVPTIFDFIVTQTTLHLTAVNLVIAIVQICLGLGFLLLSDRWVKELVIASIAMSVIFWYCSEAFGMILTGMATDFNSGLLVVVIALAAGRRCRPCAQHAHRSPVKRSRRKSRGQHNARSVKTLQRMEEGSLSIHLA